MKRPTVAPRALFVIAPTDFRDEELFVPREALERAGWSCTIASRAVGNCTGMLGGSATSTIALADVDAADYDAIVLVGGAGARTYFDDRAAHDLARACAEAGKVLAAICIAPAILARAGVLKGKRATAFASETSELVDGGALVQPASVVRDGLVVTADGPRAARDFAAAILHAAAARPSIAVAERGSRARLGVPRG